MSTDLGNGSLLVTPPYKFGWMPEDPQSYQYANVWSREKTTGPERLVIAPSNEQIQLMIELSRIMAEPFWLLYVLTVPREQNEAGRYQSASPASRKDAESFLSRFKEFFEADGRHNVWLKSTSDFDLLIYDKHNIIYAYGQLDSFEDLLSRRGMKRVEDLRFPSPHIHNYAPEFDAEQSALLSYGEWKHSPLRDSDES